MPKTLEKPPVDSNRKFDKVCFTDTQSAHYCSAAVTMMWRMRSRSS
jgi:hypothetical protein